MRTVTLADAEVRSVNIVQMIEVVFPRGSGVDGDPVREVTQYWTMDGSLLLEKDSWRHGLKDTGTNEST